MHFLVVLAFAAAQSPPAPFAAAAAAPPAQPAPAPQPSAGEQQRAALDQQRAAVRKQAELTGTRLKPWGAFSIDSGAAFDWAAGVPENAECEPLPDSEAGPLVEAASKEQSVDAKLLRAVIEQESGFHPCAVSAKGAQGLMQLMPATAEIFKLDDPFDPKQNIEAGARFLKQLLDRYGGDVTKALAAYNAGPNAENAEKIPETKAYVDAILTKIGIKPAAGPDVKRTGPQSIQTPKPIEN